MSNLQKFLLNTFKMFGMATAKESVYMDKEPVVRMRMNPDYKPAQPHRPLREFTVKGKKVMAYCKKDAITRLKHRNSKK